MPNIVPATTTVAAAGLIMMSIQDAMPANTGAELGKFLAQQPTTIANSRILQTKFDSLADAWRRNTAFSSSITEIVLDSNYQQIIGMGVAVVPLILHELRNAPEHWFWALAAITGANPAQNEPAGDIQAAADAWVRWGVDRGIIR
jgi:hypothetical protein